MLDHHTAVQSHFTADSTNTKHLSSFAFPEILSRLIILKQAMSQGKLEFGNFKSKFLKRGWGGVGLALACLEKMIIRVRERDRCALS